MSWNSASVPPLSVEILRTDVPLVAGVARRLECEVRGARPNHRVSWWKNGEQLPDTMTQVSIPRTGGQE